MCKPCCEGLVDEMEQMEVFLSECGRTPVRVFDPFGGVGAFTGGMEEAGCMKVTHAVEISPSAAETLKSVAGTFLVFLRS